MDVFKRANGHRMIKARQDNGNGNGNGNSNGAGGPAFVPGFQPTTTGGISSTRSLPGTTSSLTDTSSTSSLMTTSSSSTKTPSTTQSSSSSTSTSSSTSITSTSTSSSSIAALATAATVSTTFSTSSFSYSYPYSSLAASTTPSASPSSSSTTVGGMSVGALVGIVAGGLFGFVALLIIGSYILRRWRKHSAERDFVDEYNDFSLTAGNSGRGDDIFGPQMSQHSTSPSIGGGAGMAGRAIITNRGAMRGPNYNGGYGDYPNVDHEAIGGAYSSQPQPQAPYNPEAYSTYVPYNGGVGYQEAMRGYQGQRSFEGPTNIGYAISEPPIPQAAVPMPTSSPPPAPSTSTAPAPSTQPARTTAAAALAAAQAAAATPIHASPDQRTSAVYTEDDAYGGF